MKSRFIYFITFSLFLNIYSLGIWIYVFNTYYTQIERIEKFKDFFFGLPIMIITYLPIVLAIASIIILLRYISNNKFMSLAFIIMLLQMFFVMLFVFQHL